MATATGISKATIESRLGAHNSEVQRIYERMVELRTELATRGAQLTDTDPTAPASFQHAEGIAKATAEYSDCAHKLSSLANIPIPVDDGQVRDRPRRVSEEYLEGAGRDRAAFR